MHLVLSKEYPPQQEAVYTTNPNIATDLLATGVVTKISFCESWCRTHDPEIRVVRFIDQQVREAAIPMLAWDILGKHDSIKTLLENLNEHCRQRAQTPAWSSDLQRHALSCGLNLTQSFEQFSCMVDNTEAYAYATLASQSANPERNPLIILGPRKAGKSHLLNAIGLGYLRHSPFAKVLKIEASAFLEPQSLDKALVDLKLLLIDNLHDIAGNGIALDLVRNIGETLKIRQRQVVLSVRSESGELPGINSRFLDYLSKGVAGLCDQHGTTELA